MFNQIPSQKNQKRVDIPHVDVWEWINANNHYVKGDIEFISPSKKRKNGPLATRTNFKKLINIDRSWLLFPVVKTNANDAKHKLNFYK